MDTGKKLSKHKPTDPGTKPPNAGGMTEYYPRILIPGIEKSNSSFLRRNKFHRYCSIVPMALAKNFQNTKSTDPGTKPQNAGGMTEYYPRILIPGQRKPTVLCYDGINSIDTILACHGNWQKNFKTQTHRSRNKTPQCRRHDRILSPDFNPGTEKADSSLLRRNKFHRYHSSVPWKLAKKFQNTKSTDPGTKTPNAGGMTEYYPRILIPGIEKSNSFLLRRNKFHRYCSSVPMALAKKTFKTQIHRTRNKNPKCRRHDRILSPDFNPGTEKADSSLLRRNKFHRYCSSVPWTLAKKFQNTNPPIPEQNPPMPEA